MTVPRALIVDDSLTVRMDLAEAFSQRGFETVLRADLAGARDALARDPVDVVVLDLLLPDGDGLDLLESIRATPARRETPVILLANEMEVRDRLQHRGMQADAYAGKPYDPERLVAHARALMARSGVRDGERHALVLVVDDSLTAREDLRARLEESGFGVVTAESGEEGLRIAAQRRPNAIVVDGVMPGMDGAAFLQQIRTDPALRTTPCILLTAATAVGELGALEAGADAYVRKEEGHEVVLARIEALLRGATPPLVGPDTGVLGAKRLLVVRAPHSPLAGIAARLRDDGHVVTGAAPDDALEVLASGPVDAILVDATPSLERALELSREILAVRDSKATPLLLIGSSDEPDVVMQAMNAGADDYASIASGMEVIRARIRAQLRRRQFEEENRAREAYARSAAVLETISDAFFAVDPEWRFVYVNHAMEALSGRDRAAMIGASMWDECPWVATRAVVEELRRAVSEGRPITFETASAGERWLEVRAFPHPEGLSAHVRDVTERRRSQEVQGHLVGIVGHDLRTPLTAISASAALALRGGPLTDRQRRALERINGGAARMARLINDLLDYSRARLGHGIPIALRAADLDAICRDAIDEVATVYPGRAITYRHDGDSNGEWDPDRLQQVVTNLLTNALRYSDPAHAVELRWTDRGDERVLSVHNDGAPIATDVLEHVFEPFRRGDASGNAWGGVGLGLYIVKEIVRAHRGHVTVRSVDGEGTTFTVEIPRHSG